MTIQEQRREWSRQYRLRHPDKVAAYNKEYRRTHPRTPAQKRKHNAESIERYQKRRIEVREFYRHHHLKKAYGMTMGDLQRMLVAQAFRCAICQTEIDEFTRAIDHCHEKRRLRGLLCRNCNTAIGLLRDNPFIAIAAARYLTLPSSPPTR